jgi:IS30 family transposase
MSKNYNQLSLVQKYEIEAFLKAGMKQNLIAEQIVVHAATISLELRRNIAKRGRTSGDYVAKNTQRKTDNRHRSNPKLVKYTDKRK